MSQGKPIMVMPRTARLHEHRNDHQLSTARHFKELGRILVAMDEQELEWQLSQIDCIPTSSPTGRYASAELLATVEAFVSEGRVS